MPDAAEDGGKKLKRRRQEIWGGLKCTRVRDHVVCDGRQKIAHGGARFAKICAQNLKRIMQRRSEQLSRNPVLQAGPARCHVVPPSVTPINPAPEANSARLS